MPTHKTRGPHGASRLFSPLLYQLSYLAEPSESGGDYRRVGHRRQADAHFYRRFGLRAQLGVEFHQLHCRLVLPAFIAVGHGEREADVR